MGSVCGKVTIQVPSQKTQKTENCFSPTFWDPSGTTLANRRSFGRALAERNDMTPNGVADRVLKSDEKGEADDQSFEGEA